MLDDDSFYFEPEMSGASFEPEVSGVFPRLPRTRLERLAERARSSAGCEVAAVLDLSSEWAEVAVRGSLLDCTGAKEVILMAWLQEAQAIVLRRTPPKLLLLFGSLEVLVVPIQTPARLLGVMAVSWPTRARRPLADLGSLAAEIALELEGADRLAFRRQQLATDPAPACFDRVA